MADLQRRLTDAHDPTEEKILELIEQTHDSKDKAFLLILMKINSNLTQNTQATNDISDRVEEIIKHVDEHIKTEDALLNKGKGSLTIIMWLLGVAQGVAVWMLLHFNQQLVDVHKDIEQQRLELTQHTASEANLFSQKPADNSIHH